MKEISIRTKFAPHISSEMISQYGTKSLNALVNRYGNDHILTTIFREDCSFRQLKEYFDNRADCPNQYFQSVFLVSDLYGVTIDSNIYLYRFDPEQISQQLMLWNWCYADAKIYIGDAWWFSNDEILGDLNNLSIVNFLEKYKGF